MKKILISLAIIGIVAGATLGITGAWWSDSATSTNASFTSGNIDLYLSNTGGADSTYHKTVDETWDQDKMEPGETPVEAALWMKNFGNIDTDHISLAVANNVTKDCKNKNYNYLLDDQMRITKLEYAGESLLTGGAGADLSDYNSPSNPDVTVSTTSELEAAVSNGTDETVLVKPGIYNPSYEVCYGSYCFTRNGLKITDADTIVAENAPNSANPSVIDTGIATLETDGVIIKGFKINGGVPIWASNCEIRSNLILTDGVGVGLFGNDNLVKNNKISGSGDPEDAGIHIQASGNTVEYNTIKDFTKGTGMYNHGLKGAGIVVWSNTDDTTIEHNEIKENTIGVMASGPDRTGVTSPTNVVVNTNNIEGNSDYGVLNMKCPGSGSWNYWEYEKYSPADSTVDATNNWWRTMDESEIQKMVSDDVTWKPYAGGPFIGYINGTDGPNGNYFADLDDFRRQGIDNIKPGLAAGEYHTLNMGIQLDGPTTGNEFQGGKLGMDMTVNMYQR